MDGEIVGMAATDSTRNMDGMDADLTQTHDAQAQAVLLAVLGRRRLVRNPDYRAVPYGDGLMITAPTRHRPILRLPATPMQSQIWESFATARPVSEVLEHVSALNPPFQPWHILWAVTDFERQRILVPADEGERPGMTWPRWRAF